MTKNEKHAKYEKSVEDAFKKAGGGKIGLAAALHQVVANARDLEAEQAAEREEAMKHFEDSINKIVNVS